MRDGLAGLLGEMRRVACGSAGGRPVAGPELELREPEQRVGQDRRLAVRAGDVDEACEGVARLRVLLDPEKRERGRPDRVRSLLEELHVVEERCEAVEE